MTVTRERRSPCQYARAYAPPRDDRRRPLSSWLKVTYPLATALIATVYGRTYGPQNFLWLSDVGLAFTTFSVVIEEPLLASMPAVGVLPLELAWNLDVLTGGRLLGLAAYMFDKKLPLSRRLLSLFHMALPPTLIWMLRRFGYDRRALPLQTALTLIVLPLTYALTDPERNINWAFGPGAKPQRRLPPLLYLGLEMLSLPLLVMLPTHLLLARIFRPPRR